MSGDRRVGKLNTIELGRGLAALAVVFFHANASIQYIGGMSLDIARFGEHGVDFFFILSGFIIFHVHSQDIGDRVQARRYAINRAIRLLPILWIIVSVSSVAKFASGAPPPVSQVVESLFLVPTLKEPIPNVVWTLRHEALFYLVFLIAIINRKLGTIVFFTWILGCVVQLLLITLGTPLTGVASLIFSSFHFDFFMGAMVAYLFRKYQNRAASMIPLGICVALLASFFAAEHFFSINRLAFNDYISFAASYWTLALGLIFSGILYGLLRLEGLFKAPPAFMLLGAASYSIYLVHTLSNSIAQRMLMRLPKWVALDGFGHLLLVAVGVIGGIAVHLFIEKPIMSKLRTHAQKRSALLALDFGSTGGSNG